MNLTLTSYLKSLLEKSSQYSLNTIDQDTLNKVGTESFIFNKLASKKFRKFKMQESCIERTRQAISMRVSKSEPIHIVYPQGGYKLWRLPSSPIVDWAEFFNISYILEYIAPIAASYKPGVQITYYMHTLLMEIHDNLTTEEIQLYVDSFEKLLEEFRKYLPNNITISILRDADIYSREEYFKALSGGKLKAEEEYKTWDDVKRNKFAKMANLNIKWKGREDWTKLNEKEKEEKIYQAALYESAATSQLTRVAEKVKSSKNILIFTSASPAFIGIGSTKASMAKYWVGFGVLEKKGESFLPIVLTPKQYEDSKVMSFEKIPVDLFSNHNLREVLVFYKPFSFSHN